MHIEKKKHQVGRENILNDMGFSKHIVALALFDIQSAVVRWIG